MTLRRARKAKVRPDVFVLPVRAGAGADLGLPIPRNQRGQKGIFVDVDLAENILRKFAVAYAEPAGGARWREGFPQMKKLRAAAARGAVWVLPLRVGALPRKRWREAVAWIGELARKHGKTLAWMPGRGIIGTPAMPKYATPPFLPVPTAAENLLAAEEAWARARRTIPHYAALPEVPFAAAPILRKETLLLRWLSFFPARLRWPEDFRQGYYVRESSGSSADRLQSVVEAAVMRRRSLSKILISPESLGGRIAYVNRVDNFAAGAPVPYVRQQGTELFLSPGPFPFDAGDAAYDACIDALKLFLPETLHGDPAFLFGLARRLRARGEALPTVRYVDCGHTYLWGHYRRSLAAAFGAQIVARFHASELGDIAVSCMLGRLHLLEDRIHYEILDDRERPTRLGRIGDLVATTLDTTVRPLIRYATGDRVRLTGDACACGRPFRTIAYEGRARERLRHPRTGKTLGLSDLDAAIRRARLTDFFQLVVGPAVRLLARDADGARVEAARAGLEKVLGRRVALDRAAAFVVPKRGKFAALTVEF